MRTQKPKQNVTRGGLVKAIKFCFCFNHLLWLSSGVERVEGFYNGITGEEEKEKNNKMEPFPYVPIKFIRNCTRTHVGRVLTFVFQMKSGILILIQRPKSGPPYLARWVMNSLWEHDKSSAPALCLRGLFVLFCFRAGELRQNSRTDANDEFPLCFLILRLTFSFWMSPACWS